MSIVRFKPQSLRDIDTILDYLADQNVDAALRLYTAIRRDTELLARMPGIGPLYGFSDPTYADMRYWPVKHFSSYLIFYRLVPDGIEVLRILHGARDIPQLFDRT